MLGLEIPGSPLRDQVLCPIHVKEIFNFLHVTSKKHTGSAASVITPQKTLQYYDYTHYMQSESDINNELESEYKRQTTTFKVRDVK